MTPNRTLQKLIKNKAAKKKRALLQNCLNYYTMIKCIKYPIKSIDSESNPGY